MPGIVGPNYNARMDRSAPTTVFPPTARRLGLLGAGLALIAGSHALAQPPATSVPQQAPVTTLEQKTERITHEDAGSRIEELRVGGQTRRIDVQTNTNVPGYQVEPIDPGQANDAKGTAGKSSWRLLSF